MSNLTEFLNGALGFLIVIMVLFMLYAGIKKQTISETWNEVKELFNKKKDDIRYGIGEIPKK